MISNKIKYLCNCDEHQIIKLHILYHNSTYINIFKLGSLANVLAVLPLLIWALTFPPEILLIFVQEVFSFCLWALV